ncbi:MAG TPA: ATP/GTP-binding protein [Chryseolinea sp.]|nr:ATP/GTP-binding protein [Chryseolinea sp.]HPM29070.1 ATP/GTP-binding protein [Chryseolinea sp.]
MKIQFSFLFALIITTTQAQHSIEKLWESDSLAIPESVLFDKTIMYVSLIDGQPWEADGKGGVATMDKNGKILNATWVTGLSAPKGMGIWDKKLYVADISEVVVINTATGKVESKIPVEGATGLNDITIDKKGIVYVSDSKNGNVHTIIKGKAELYLSGLKGVNGLKSVDNDLYILTANDIFKTGADKKLITIATTEIGGDGIEPVGNGDYVVSCWPGLIYYLDKEGKLEIMLDTREQKRNTADIGYNAAERIVYVPTFMKKSIVAFKLK